MTLVKVSTIPCAQVQSQALSRFDGDSLKIKVPPPDLSLCHHKSLINSSAKHRCVKVYNMLHVDYSHSASQNIEQAIVKNTNKKT